MMLREKTRRSRTPSLTFIALLLTLTSCGVNESKPGGPLEILPLAVGNRWDYTVNGQPYSMFVTHDTLVNGVRWYWLEDSYGEGVNFSYAREHYFRNGPEGLWQKSNDTAMLAIAYPVSKVDSQFNYTHFAQVDVIDTLITLAAGQFNTIGYALPSGRHDKSENFFSPAVGLVYARGGADELKLVTKILH